MRLSRAGRCWTRAIFWGGVLSGVLIAGTNAAEVEADRVYDANCALCHQKAGAGLKGQFPRLAGRASEIGATPAGRRYLIEVVLFGMAGTVQVDGASIFGVMPPFASLSDDDLAAALNYIISLDAKKPTVIEAKEIKGVRGGQQLSPTQVHVNREAVLGTPHR